MTSSDAGSDRATGDLGKDAPERRIHEEPIEEGAASGSSLAPSVHDAEGLDTASDAEALRTDPDEAVNRSQAGEPPRPERAGPPPEQDASVPDDDPADEA